MSDLRTTTCDLTQVRALVTHHLAVLWEQPGAARGIPPLMLWGPPGVGKSDVVRGLCEEHDIGFVDVRLAQREPIDIRGLPVPRDGAVHWMLPAEWPREGRGIILFDELTAADRTLQVAAYEFILDRRLGDLYSVPDGWYVMAAGNRTSDRAVATTMSSALANRFCHLEVEADVHTWSRWALGAEVHGDVIAFLRFKPDLLFDQRGNLERGWPSPRSWERVSTELKHGEALPVPLLRALIHGLVGPGAGTEFMAFRQWACQIPDVLEMLKGRAAVVIPERADQRFALCTAVAHHLWRMPDVNTALRAFFDVGQGLTGDFAALLMADAMERATPEQAATLLDHTRFEHWSKQHGAAFAAREAAAAARIADAPTD